MKRGFLFLLLGLKKRSPKAITEDREQFIFSVGRTSCGNRLQDLSSIYGILPYEINFTNLMEGKAILLCRTRVTSAFRYL